MDSDDDSRKEEGETSTEATSEKTEKTIKPKEGSHGEFNVGGPHVATHVDGKPPVATHVGERDGKPPVAT